MVTLTPYTLLFNDLNSFIPLENQDTPISSTNRVIFIFNII